MKRIISGILSVVIVLGGFTYVSAETQSHIDKPTTTLATNQDKKENRITYFDEKMITAEVIDKDAVLYTASYENGALKSIEINTFDGTGEKTFELKTKADKAFLWSKNMEPYDMKELKKQPDTDSSEISLDHTSYPLYTGVSNKSTFSDWQTSGSSVTITADVHNGKNSVSDVIWTIADDTVATLTINSKNQATVKGLRTGYTTITAALPNGEAANCSISVIDNAARLTTQRIELNTDRLKLSEGQSATLKPIFYPKDIYNLGILNTSLSWQSSDTAVATVNENGVVTAVGSGAAKITATSADVGRTAQCNITVTNGIVQNEITADDKITDMTVGEQVTLKSETDGEIIWKSDNSYIADVDKQGVVTAYSNSNVQNVSADGLTVTETAGTVKVYATAVNGGKTAEYEIRVAPSDIADKYLVPSDGVFGKTEYSVSNKTTDLSVENTKEIDIDEVNQIKATSNGDSRILWINTNQNIATLDREGNVQGYNTGTVKSYAVTEDSLTAEQLKAVKALQGNRENADEDVLAAINGAVYDQCEVTVKNSSPYLRNVHIPKETITDNSANILWNRAALNNISDFKEYKVYVNNELLDTVTTLGYTVNNLNAETEYEFKITAVSTDGSDIISETIRVETKPATTKVLNVLDYGARGDGTTMDTFSIQKAINDCPENGMVYLPSGYVFYSGALFLKSNMTFKVDGIVMGSIDPKDYPRWVTKWEGWRKTEQTSNEWANTTGSLPNNHKPHSSLINAGKYDEGVYGMTGPYNVENLVICGKGQINANGFALGFNEGPNATYGKDWTSYPYPVKDPTQRGRAITVHNGRNIYIKDVTIAYSPSWTTHLIYCDGVTVDNAQIVSQGNGNGGRGKSVEKAAHIPNGDGIDPESCTNLNVFNTRMSTGDDSFTMKSGRNREGNELDKPNAYIRVTDCTTAFSLGGYGYGSENAAGAHDVLFQNITVDTVALSGFWFKTNKARGGISENIQVRDADIRNAGYATVCANHTYSSSQTNAASSLPVLRYITFENIVGKDNGKGYEFEGLNGSNIYGVTIIGGSMNNKSSYVKYGKDFTVLDCEDTEWSCENSSNIDILSTAVLEDTKLSVKTGAYKIKEIDNEMHIIYAYKGTSADEVLAGIDSLLEGKQTYEVSGNSITVTAQDGEHSAIYIIDLSSDIPNDGYINSLSVKSGDKELLKNFNRDTTEYNIKSAKESDVTVTALTNDINASVNITNNGAEFDGSLTDGINELKITVTSSDNSDTKIYTVTIDNSYMIAEDFSSVTDDKWGFSGGNNASISAMDIANASDIESETLKLLTSNSSGSSLTKVFPDDISSLKKADVQFDWKSNMNSSKGRWGYLALQDSEGNYIFSMYANDKNSIGYAMINPTENSALTNIAKFSRTWYTVSLALDFENGTVKGTITERDTGKVLINIDSTINASNLSKMYAYDGYSATPMSIDNVYIKQGDFNND